MMRFIQPKSTWTRSRLRFLVPVLRDAFRQKSGTGVSRQLDTEQPKFRIVRNLPSEEPLRHGATVGDKHRAVFRGSSFLERGTCENWSAAERGVEGIGRYRG